MSIDHSKVLDEISHLRAAIKEKSEETVNSEIKMKSEMAEKNKQLDEITFKLNSESETYQKERQSKNDVIKEMKIINENLKEELSREKKTTSENISLHKSQIEEKLSIEIKLRKKLADSQNRISCFESDIKTQVMETERLNRIIVQLRDGFTKLEKTYEENAKEKEVLAKQYQDLRLKNDTLNVNMLNIKKELQQCMSNSLSEIDSWKEQFREKSDENKKIMNESKQKLQLYEHDILVWKNRAIEENHLVEEKSAELVQIQFFYSQERNKILSQIDELTVELAISKEVGNSEILYKV